ncbi:hypothetical protein R5R35_005223 [Gryllus longicercus]|uniref:Uncharacterized protein n=1 Tax=Gryllus longicercus TaxID=2509291 RepID=A0AAN9VEK8_9ORTH
MSKIPNQSDSSDDDSSKKEFQIGKEKQYDRDSTKKAKETSNSGNKHKDEPTPSTSRQQDPTTRVTNPYQDILDSGEDPKKMELKILERYHKDLLRKEHMLQKQRELDASNSSKRGLDGGKIGASREPAESGSELKKNKKNDLPKSQQKPETPPEVRRHRAVARWRCAIKKVIRAKRNAKEE